MCASRNHRDDAVAVLADVTVIRGRPNPPLRIGCSRDAKSQTAVLYLTELSPLSDTSLPVLSTGSSTYIHKSIYALYAVRAMHEEGLPVAPDGQCATGTVRQRDDAALDLTWCALLYRWQPLANGDLKSYLFCSRAQASNYPQPPLESATSDRRTGGSKKLATNFSPFVTGSASWSVRSSCSWEQGVAPNRPSRGVGSSRARPPRCAARRPAPTARGRPYLLSFSGVESRHTEDGRRHDDRGCRVAAGC